MDILETSHKRVVNDMSLEIKVRGAREKRLQLDNGHKIVSCYYHIVTMLLFDDFDVLLIIIYMILHLYMAFTFMKNNSRHLPYVEDCGSVGRLQNFVAQKRGSLLGAMLPIALHYPILSVGVMVKITFLFVASTLHW